MNAIYTLFSSFANLARSLNRLAATVDAVADEAERRVEVIGHTPAAPVPSLLSTDGPAIVSTNGNGHAELAKAGGRSRK